MFLALSSDKHLWPKNEEIYFLGRWCLNLDEIKEKKFNIHPYHWDNHDKLLKDNEYILKVYKKTIPKLSQFLNKIHNENNPTRYWEILVGQWLLKFLEYLYDKYYVVTDVVSKNKNLKTFITKEYLPLQTYERFYEIHTSPEFVFRIFSEIISTLKLKLEYKTINNLNISFFEITKPKNRANIFSLPKIIFRFIRQNFYYLPKIYLNKYEPDQGKIGNYNIPLSSKEKIRLSNRVNRIDKAYGATIPDKIIENFVIDNKVRNNYLNFENENDEFYILISKMLISNIPMEYIEHYKELKEHYNKYLPKNKLDKILIRSPYECGTKARIFSSLIYLKGTKIVSFQEGGAGKLHMHRKLEHVNFIGCDEYYTWGKKPFEYSNPKTKSFYFVKTFWLEDKYNYDPKGNLMLVAGSCRPVFFSVYEGHNLSYSYEQIEFNKVFLLNLKDNIRKNSLYRFHKQFGIGEVDYITKAFPDIQISLREKESHFYKMLSSSRIKIFTTDYTANTQSIYINHPTVMMWGANNIITNPIYKDLYDEMRKNKILFHDPIKCSNHINEIYENPEIWWRQKDVQKTRDIFLETFCRSSTDIVKDFKNEILKLN